MMSKVFKENYLSKDNGCTIIEVSSEQRDSKRVAANILSDNRNLLWLTQGQPPQYCIINTSNMKQYPKVFNRIAFFCWHQYQTNPSLIEISYSNSAEQEWTKVGKFKLERISEKQYFKIKDIPATEMKLLKVNILQNFGDNITYLNQIELGFVKESNANDQNREKTFSEYVKLTSTEKQLKKAQDKLKKISEQNVQIKSTVMRQGQIMLQMQQSFKLLTKQLEKLHRIQQIQQEKIQRLQRKEKSKRKKDTNSLQNYYQSENDEEKKYIEDTLISKKTKEFLNSYSYAKSQKNSLKKSKQSETIPENKTKKSHISKQDHYGTQSDLSEYNASQNEQSKYTQKCSDMVERLQKLIAQKQKRERQLKKKSVLSKQ